MELEEKIRKINKKLKDRLKDKNNIVIRGGGIHTERLLSLTCIIEFWDKISIVDKRPYGAIGNKPLMAIDQIQWDLVDAVIISSLIYQDDMENELLANKSFQGEIIRLYEEGEVSEFFELQKDHNFLTLEKVESWDIASAKSNLGYADDAILQFDYNEFIEHKNQCGKNRKRHHYDLLFYIIKTVMQLQKNEITVLDFGGGFGTVYVDLKYYLKDFDIKFKWIIVEQEKIVEHNEKEPNDVGIIFKKRIDDIDEKDSIDFVILGSCIQYIKNDEEIIQKLMSCCPHRIAVLKTPVSDKTFFTVQHVNRMKNYNYYVGDYACRVMKEEELISLFSGSYKLEDVEEDPFNARDVNLNNHIVKWKDFFFVVS